MIQELTLRLLFVSPARRMRDAGLGSQRVLEHIRIMLPFDSLERQPMVYYLGV